MKFENIFFDLDGTLIDSKERLYRLFTDLLPNVKISYDEYWYYKMSRNSNEWILKHKFWMSDEQILKFKKIWLENIERYEYLSFDKLFPDTLNVLDQLYNKVYMYVVTARQSIDNLLLQLDQLKLTNYFKTILITEQKTTKVALINSLQIPLVKSLIIGDTGEETIIGKELGLTTANVLTGFRNRTVLESYHPDFIFPNLAKFAECILAD